MKVANPGRIILLSTIFLCLNFVVATAQDEGNLSREQESIFKLSVTYLGDIFGNISGGEDTGIRYMDNLDVNLEVDFENTTVPGLSGTTIYMYGIGNQGASITELAGDLQGTSNIEAENSWRMYELWAQKKFFLANSSILLGLYDVNAEFNYLQSSQLFLNSSHGIDPTIALSGTLGPSIFPYTSLGARFKFNPFNGLVVQAAVLDGVPSDPGNTKGTKIMLREDDGLFFISEISFHSVQRGNLQLRNRVKRINGFLDREVNTDNTIAAGAWYYTKEKESWNPERGQNHEYGLYILGEYKFADNHKNIPPIQLFARAGMANPKVSTLSAFFGGGFMLEGIFAGREDDATGFAVAHAAAGSPFINHNLISNRKPAKAETNFEWTHRFRLNEYFQLQLDVQYILNPGLDPTKNNALVSGIRGIIGF